MLASPSYVKNLEKRLKSNFGMAHGELDLLVGGPPCQGFSGIGHRRSYSVAKEHLPSNHLFQDMATLIRLLKPRAFLFENVRGLLHAKWNEGGAKGEIWERVKKEFVGIRGYRIATKLVYAKDYGVPQNRPRVLLVGIRDDVRSDLIKDFDAKDGSADAVDVGFLPRPSKRIRAPDPIDLLGDLVDPNYQNGGVTTEYPSDATHPIQKKLRTPHGGGRVFRKGDPVTEHEYSKHNEKVLAKFRAMIESGGEVPEQFKTKKFAQRVLPERWADEPTITATSLPDDYVHFSQPRTPTVREWARLQMFPDWYQFEGKRSTGGIRRAGNPREGNFERELPKYTQIGNAVPVGLAEAVGEHLAKILRS
jgi:DNA (cytosine-5)-methyltransferase 1